MRNSILTSIVFMLASACVFGSDNNETDSKSDVYEPPLLKNLTAYEDLSVSDSRTATFFALSAYLRSKERLTVGPVLPIGYQESDGTVVSAWEVGIYAEGDGKLMYVYVVEAESGRVHLVCDKLSDPECG